MITRRADLHRLPQAQDWVRWGFVAVPMFAAMPRANTLSWILIGITLVLSIPLLWIYDAAGHRLLPVITLTVIAAAGTLWAMVPNSWASVTMFSTTFFVVLRQSTVPIVLAVGVDLAAISVLGRLPPRVGRRPADVHDPRRDRAARAEPAHPAGPDRADRAGAGPRADGHRGARPRRGARRTRPHRPRSCTTSWRTRSPGSR